MKHEKLSSKLSLKVNTQLEELTRVYNAVESFGKEQEWTSELIFCANLVLEELGINVINHGYDEGNHEFEIIVVSNPESITIEIIDSGRPFDPLKDAPEPALNAEIEDRPIGGLGVHFVQKMMDELHYRRENGKNHFTATKRRDG